MDWLQQWRHKLFCFVSRPGTRHQPLPSLLSGLLNNKRSLSRTNSPQNTKRARYHDWQRPKLLPELVRRDAWPQVTFIGWKSLKKLSLHLHFVCKNRWDKKYLIGASKRHYWSRSTICLWYQRGLSFAYRLDSMEFAYSRICLWGPRWVSTPKKKRTPDFKLQNCRFQRQKSSGIRYCLRWCDLISAFRLAHLYPRKVVLNFYTSY